MPFDPSLLSPKSREAYIKLGKQYGSTDTLKQADKTLLALKDHGAKLGTFSAEDGARLSEVRKLLGAAVDERKNAQGNIKTTNKAYLDAVALGKVALLSGRTTLQNSRSDLEESTDPSVADALRALDTALTQTRSSENDADKLAGQLGTLLNLLGETEDNPNNQAIAQVTKGRGRATAIFDLTKHIAALNVIIKQGNSGTPSETEEMDLLDGIIVTLTRKARKAAREADKKSGTRALGKEFELSELYRSTGNKKPKEKGSSSAALEKN